MSLSRATCSECPNPVEGRALTCSDRCRTARSRRRSSARAAERLESFEALLLDDEVSDEVREAYAGLVEDVPAFRMSHARAMQHGAEPDEEEGYAVDLAVQAREWLRSWVLAARPGSRIGRSALYFEAEDSWHGSRVERPISPELFDEIARSLLRVDDLDRYVVPPRAH